MTDLNKNQREATHQWYFDWLAENFPDMMLEQREEQATAFAEQQLPIPPPPSLSDLELEEYQEEQEKLNELRRRAHRYTVNEMSDKPREQEPVKPPEVK